MADTMSDVVVNGDPEQAFRAGFREGVKLSLDRGVLPRQMGIHCPRII